MGSDKAFLRLREATLLEHAISAAKQIGANVVLVGDRTKLYPYGMVVEDILPERGPLGGIYSALKCAAVREWNLILAVDTPAIPPSFLNALLEIARNSKATVTVPRIGSYAQPLCAVYRPDFALAAEKSLNAGRNKIDSLFSAVSTRVVEEDEIKNLGFTADIFDNVNTAEDWQRMQQRFGTDCR